MARVSSCLLLILYTDFCIESLPIKSGFSVKFKPFFTKDEIQPKTFGSIFAKISQDFTPEAILRQQIFSKVLPPPPPSLGNGCTNQVARMVPPASGPEDNKTQLGFTPEFFNLPIIKQPFKDYKVLVATAPPDIKIGRGENSKNFVIYVVFNEEPPGDDNSAGGMVTVPEIYFLNKQANTRYDLETKHKAKPRPIFIVDNNRTVTGLKSKQVEKILSFRNKLMNRYNYQVDP